MPKTKRDRLKGSVATAMMQLDGAMAQVAELHTAFSEQHPELADGMVLSADLIAQCQAVLEAFYIASWGPLPDSWTATRNRK